MNRLPVTSWKIQHIVEFLLARARGLFRCCDGPDWRVRTRGLKLSKQTPVRDSAAPSACRQTQLPVSMLTVLLSHSGSRNRSMAVDDHRLPAILGSPVVPHRQTEFIGFARGLSRRDRTPSPHREPRPCISSRNPSVRDYQFRPPSST